MGHGTLFLITVDGQINILAVVCSVNHECEGWTNEELINSTIFVQCNIM